jgi:hypothetical protein
MKQTVLFIFFIYIISVTVTGQGLIIPELPPLDTTETYSNDLLLDKTLTNYMISGGLITPVLNQTNFKLPKFDFSKELFMKKQNYSYYIFNPESKNNVNFPFTASPYLHSATIFNQAAYNISDKFVIGGNSFGAQSIFSAPLPNSGMNKFDTKGASMFFQYKVSKKFKIETRVSITNRQF